MKLGSLSVDQLKLREICKQFGVREMAVFGSVLRPDFDSSSDVDLLVRFEPSARFRMLSIAELEEAIGELLTRPVDVLDWDAVEEDPNWVMRRSILESARRLDVA